MNTLNMKRLALACLLVAAGYGTAVAAASTVGTGTVAGTVLPAKIGLEGLKADGGYERFIVHYKAGSAEHAASANALQSLTVAAAKAGLAQSSKLSVQGVARAATFSFRRHTATGGMVFKSSRGLSKAEAISLMEQIAANPDVTYVEPDIRLYAFRDVKAADDVAPVTPDDKYYAYQWHFRPGDGTAEQIGSDTSAYDNYGGSDVSRAWNLSDGSGVVVAVIDTGITKHPDLDTSLADDSYDMISDAFTSGRDSDGRVKGAWDLGDWTTGDKYLASNGGCVDYLTMEPEDSSWHGTHVAGNIGELTNNETGMAGIANGAKVLPIRALGHCGGSLSDIADAVVWASGGHVDGLDDNTHPAQVINMSLGGSGICTSSSEMGQAVAEAIANGSTVVVAAGNSDVDASKITPASCAGVITVASNGITGKPAFYSDYGSVVALSAPGGGIYANDASSGDQVQAGFDWSALNSGTTVPADPVYGGMAGTSQATPEVAGTVALIISARKAAGLDPLPPAQIRDILTSTVRPFPTTPGNSYGAGILDAYAAVSKAISAADPVDLPVALTNGVLSPFAKGSYKVQAVYSLDVPTTAKMLTLRTLGGAGDVSIYVKQGAIPTTDDATYTSARSGNNESVTVTNAKAGTWYMLVTGITPDTNFSVMGVYTK